MNAIEFNRPFLAGNELTYIADAVRRKHISGNGHYTKLCHSFLEDRYQFKKVLLTNSCTDALEMCAILLDIKPGDEVIIPSYTFVSTANAFILRGATIVFADSQYAHPNIDSDLVKSLITRRTKVIVVVHYAGMACDMDGIMTVAKAHDLFVVEDAAQAIGNFYKGKPLGGIGHLSAFSFHETKNIISGEGGMLVVNDSQFERRADIIWEKGTNRKAFFNGEVAKYGWVDIGSSFLPSEIMAAFLFAQLEQIDLILAKRNKIWEYYYSSLNSLLQKDNFKLPFRPEFTTNNGHIFYILCENQESRDKLLAFLKARGISAVFHYQSLHRSPFFKEKHDGRELPRSDYFSDCLIRLPLHLEITHLDQDRVAEALRLFFNGPIESKE